MRNFGVYLKLTAQGGLLVLMPILLFVLLLKEMVGLVVGLTAPIASLLPAGAFENFQHTGVSAAAFLVGLSLLIGFFLKSDTAKKCGRWIEEKTIKKLSIYQFVKTLVSGLLAIEDNTNFKPALFDTQNGQQEIIYLVEDLGNGKYTALFPIAPTGFSGPIRIITKDCIIPLKASLGEVSLVLNHMGLGAGRLLEKNSR